MSLLTISHISKSYGKIKAVDDFSLTVNRGEIFALVGPDGAGKTTLIRVICRLLDADSGSITIDNRDIHTNFDEIKPFLGYMPQSFSLYPDLSVEENLTFYAGIYGFTGQEYIAKRDYLYSFSNLAPFAKRRASALSGGMKQKLALSCALVHDPQILILDEPTTGVDPLSRHQFWEILLELKAQGRTILVSTPYMDEVAYADRACFTLGGRKLSEGTPADLTRQFEGVIYHADIVPSADLVRKLNNIAGIKARRFGAGLHLYTDTQESFKKSLPSLAALDIDTNLLRAIPPTLEDRFIQLMESTQ